MQLRSRHTTPAPNPTPPRAPKAPVLNATYYPPIPPPVFPVERSSNPFFSNTDNVPSSTDDLEIGVSGSGEMANSGEGHEQEEDVEMEGVDAYRSTDPNPAPGSGMDLSLVTSATVEAFELESRESQECESTAAGGGPGDAVVLEDSMDFETMTSSQEVPLADAYPIDEAIATHDHAPTNAVAHPTMKVLQFIPAPNGSRAEMDPDETITNHFGKDNLARGQKRKRSAPLGLTVSTGYEQGHAFGHVLYRSNKAKVRDENANKHDNARRARARSAPAPPSSTEKMRLGTRRRRAGTPGDEVMDGMSEDGDLEVAGPLSEGGSSPNSFEARKRGRMGMGDIESEGSSEEEEGSQDDREEFQQHDDGLADTSASTEHALTQSHNSEDDSDPLTEPEPTSEIDHDDDSTFEPVPISDPKVYASKPYVPYQAVLIPSPTKIPNPSPPKRKRAKRVADLMKVEEREDVREEEDDDDSSSLTSIGEGPVGGMDVDGATMADGATTMMGTPPPTGLNAQAQKATKEAVVDLTLHSTVDLTKDSADPDGGTGDFEIIEPSDGAGQGDLEEDEEEPCSTQQSVEQETEEMDAGTEDATSTQPESGEVCTRHGVLCGEQCGAWSGDSEDEYAEDEALYDAWTNGHTSSAKPKAKTTKRRAGQGQLVKNPSSPIPCYDPKDDLPLWLSRSKTEPTKRDLLMMQPSSDIFETQDAFLSRPFADRLEAKWDMRKFAKANEVFDHRMAHEDLKWIVVDRLGEGTFSSVYKAVDMDLCEMDVADGFSGLAVSHWDSSEGNRKVRSSQHRILYKGKQLLKHGKVPFVAIKRIYVTSSPQRIANELELMEDLRGARNISELITAFRQQDQVYAVMPFHENDDFRLFYKRLDPPNIRLYMRCLLRALKDTHRRGIVHRDVKPANFLFDYASGRGYLCDFGLAERYRPPTRVLCQHYPAAYDTPHGYSSKMPTTKMAERAVQTAKTREESGVIGFPLHDKRASIKANRAGTRGFRAPEVLLKCPDQTVAIDIWAAGIILLSILCHKFPLFNSNDDMEALLELSEVFGKAAMERCGFLHNRTFLSNFPMTETHPRLLDLILTVNPRLYDPPAPCCTPEEAQTHIETIDSIVDLVKHMLRLDATKRYTAHDCLMHRFLQTGLAEDELERNEAIWEPAKGACQSMHKIRKNGQHVVYFPDEEPIKVGWGQAMAYGDNACSYHDGSRRPTSTDDE